MKTHDQITDLPHGTATMDFPRRDFLLKSAAGKLATFFTTHLRAGSAA